MRNITPELEHLLRDYRSELSGIQLDIPAIALPEVEAEPAPNAPQEDPAALPALKATRASGAAVSKTRFHFGRFAVLVVLAALSAAGLKKAYVQASGRAQHSFPLPWAQTGALAFQGSNIVTVDPQRQLLFTLATDGTGVRSEQKIQNALVSGLTFGNGCLWSSNAESGVIYQHDLNHEHTVRRAYANPDQNPSALYWDGTSLWASDARTETIYQYSAGDALTPVRQFTLPKVSPAGIYVSDNLLWIFDSITLKLYRYRMGITLTMTDSLDLSSRLPADSTVTGFSVDHSDLWLITEKPSGLHRFDLKSLFLRPKKS